MKTPRLFAGLALATATLGGCAAPAFDFVIHDRPRIWVGHSPLNPDPGQAVTFTATAELGGATLDEISITALLPDGRSDQTCAGNPCTLIVTPSTGGVALYSARLRTAGGIEEVSPATYGFHVGQPAAAAQPVALRVPFDLLEGDQIGDVLLVADSAGYPGGPLSLTADAESLLYDGLLADPAYRWRDDQLGFWLSRFSGTTSGYYSGLRSRCGQDPWAASPDPAGAAAAAAFADVVAVVHRSGFRDCAGLGVVMSGAGTKRNFSADGLRPDLFQHEFGHAFAGLSDEYAETTASRTAPGGPAPDPSLCTCCDEDGGGPTQGGPPSLPCPPNLPSCIGFVPPPECSPAQPACPPLGTSCEQANIFPTEAACQAAANAAATHPGVENPQPPGDCRRLCSNNAAIDAPDCPCTTSTSVEWWILDRRHPLVATLEDDVMGSLDMAAPAEQHGPACALCLETRFCLEWELARDRSPQEAAQHCLDPQEEGE